MANLAAVLRVAATLYGVITIAVIFALNAETNLRGDAKKPPDPIEERIHQHVLVTLGSFLWVRWPLGFVRRMFVALVRYVVWLRARHVAARESAAKERADAARHYVDQGPHR